LEKELQLPNIVLHNKSQVRQEKKVGKDSLKRGKIRYPHFESFHYTGNLKKGAEKTKLEPVALYGEFPQLNSRSKEKSRRENLHLIPGERESGTSYQYPVKILQENYQTNFNTQTEREGREEEQVTASYFKTDVQPFVHIQTEAKTAREDKFG